MTLEEEVQKVIRASVGKRYVVVDVLESVVTPTLNILADSGYEFRGLAAKIDGRSALTVERVYKKAMK